MNDSDVVLERAGAITRVILNRPERRNALGVRTLPALHEVLDAIEADRDIGVVVLTGRGPVFCGGGDLDEIMSPERTGQEWEFGFIRGYNRVAPTDEEQGDYCPERDGSVEVSRTGRTSYRR